MGKCTHCDEPFDKDLDNDSSHKKEHPDLCCDCYDLSWGMALEKINEERAKKGKPPIIKPWPR